MNNEIPRKNKAYLRTPSETAIFNATQQVENLGASEKLTEAVMLLAKAGDLVAEFIDEEIKKSI